MRGSRRRKLILAALIGLPLALIVALTTLLTWGAGSGAGSQSLPAITPSPSATSAAPSASAHPSAPAHSSTPPTATNAGLPGFAWGGSDTPHHLVMQILATRSVYAIMAWRAPTAANGSGTATMTGTSWSHALTVYGAPYFVRFYTQFGPNVGAVTCRVSVDGRLRAEHTVTGRYGGVWCVG